MLNRNSARRERNRFGFIARQIMGRFTATQPKVTDIPLGYIPCSIEVGTQAKPAVFTSEEATMPLCIHTSAERTLLTGASWISVNYPASLFNSFIFYKALELPERPFMYPPIIFGCPSDISQVLHYDCITASQVIDNLSGNIVVDPSHKPFPTASNFSYFPARSPCAFRLDFSHKLLMLHSQMLDAFEEPTIAGDSKVVNAEVNPNDLTVVTAVEVDLFGKHKAEKELSILINQVALPNSPVKIFPITFRDLNRKFNPAIYGRYGKNFPFFDRSTPWEVVSDCHLFVDYGFGLGLLGHFNSLFDGINTELRLQTINLFDFIITNIMEFYSVCDAHLPSKINTKLNSLGIGFYCLDNSIIKRNFHLSRNHRFHDKYLTQRFKYLTEVNGKFIQALKDWVSFAKFE